MAVDERARHDLYNRLVELLGDEDAMTLMAHLPPAGWADVAMKRDLDALEQRLGLRIDRLDQRIDGLDQRIDGLAQRFDGLDQRFDGIDQRFDRLDESVDLKVEASEQRLLAAFRKELVTQTRVFVFAMVGSSATIASLAFAAARSA